MVNKIAYVSGIIFIIFSALSGIINYELDTVMYLSTAPAKLIETSVLTAMLPFIVSAVLSFAVAVLISRARNLEAEKETETLETETQETETQTKEEIDFEETPT